MRLNRLLPILAVALAAIALTGCDPAPSNEAATNGNAPTEKSGKASIDGNAPITDTTSR